MKLTLYTVTLELEVNEDECGHPREWDWELLMNLTPNEKVNVAAVTKTGTVDVVDETEEND